MKKLMVLLFLILNVHFVGAEGVGNHGFMAEGVGNIISGPIFHLATTQMTSHMAFIWYPAKLTVKHVSETETVIDNSGMVKSDDQTSSIKFELMTGKPGYQVIDNVDKLKSVLKGFGWKAIKIPGASGYAKEKTTRTRFGGEYYLLTLNKDIIHVQVNSFSQAGGLDLIAPIIHTLSYDVTPPVIHEIKLEGNSTMTPGQSGRVLLRVTDDISGVHTLKNMRSGVGFWNVDEKGDSLMFGGSLISLGNDWYAYDFTIDAEASAGNYVLSSVAAMDNAENMTILSTERNSPYFHDREKNIDFKNLPLVKLAISRTTPPDKRPPEILELKAQAAEVRACETIKLRARASYKGQPFSSKKLFDKNISGFWGGNLTSLEGPSGYEGNSGTLATVEVGKDLYEIEYKVSCWTKPGEYVLSTFYVADYSQRSAQIMADSSKGYYLNRDGQVTGLPLVKFKVLADSREDQTPPVIVEMKTEGEFKIGSQNASLLVKAFDSQSGIDPQATSYGRFVLIDSPEGKGFKVDNVRIEHKVTPEGYGYGVSYPLPAAEAGWFRYMPDYNEYLPPGIYYLDHYSISDRAGNYIELKANLKDGFYHAESRPGQEGEITKFPIIKVNLKR